MSGDYVNEYFQQVKLEAAFYLGRELVRNPESPVDVIDAASHILMPATSELGSSRALYSAFSAGMSFQQAFDLAVGTTVREVYLETLFK